jgi:hypothetical protein
MKNITAMDISRQNRSFFLIILMIATTVFLLVNVDWGRKLDGLNKNLGNKDLADFNWTFAR